MSSDPIARERSAERLAKKTNSLPKSFTRKRNWVQTQSKKTVSREIANDDSNITNTDSCIFSSILASKLGSRPTRDRSKTIRPVSNESTRIDAKLYLASGHLNFSYTYKYSDYLSYSLIDHIP